MVAAIMTVIEGFSRGKTPQIFNSPANSSFIPTLLFRRTGRN